MSGRLVRFAQVDVFTSVPFKGNPLAVVFDADSLDHDAMLAIARWTNLSETTFVCTPTDPDADYRVRIFTPAGELPFAGHPTLGTAHAFLASGARPRTAGRLVQQCGVGRVVLREQGDGWAFAAPPARFTPVDRADYAALAAALRSDAIDPDAEACAVDNGAPWLVVRLTSADACIGLATDPAALEHVVWTLLRRYGVVFWRLLEREADWLPSWRELVRVLQRLEARGEIRGGRFVAGLAGEQFALPEAIPILREMRRQPGDGQTVCVTGVDPLNLVGTLLPGDKVPALAGNRVLFRDGVPIASLVSGAFRYVPDLTAAEREDARIRLARRY
ncbi:PhzF family phenazine biosynthesis protein [Burkholderia multivorans]|nr:PhzF family phenazine biosynthesis protein [Burkholderia multivorans]RAA56714.1 PhzF family phenazine biosynthesis protein [Burkholderia multivorans]